MVILSLTGNPLIIRLMIKFFQLLCSYVHRHKILRSFRSHCAETLGGKQSRLAYLPNRIKRSILPNATHRSAPVTLSFHFNVPPKSWWKSSKKAKKRLSGPRTYRSAIRIFLPFSRPLPLSENGRHIMLLLYVPCTSLWVLLRWQVWYPPRLLTLRFKMSTNVYGTRQAV